MKDSVLAMSDSRGIEGQLNHKYEHETCIWIDSSGTGKHQLILKETNTFTISKSSLSSSHINPYAAVYVFQQFTAIQEGLSSRADSPSTSKILHPFL
jgi:hypothetical protein